MSTGIEKEIVLIESQKSAASFEAYKNKFKKVGIGIAIVFFLFYFIIGCISSDEFALWLFLAVVSIGLLDGIIYLAYWLSKLGYNNIWWIVTNKGLTQVNRKTGFKIFVPTNHISSISHIKETISVITIDANQPMSLTFLENANELKAVLDDLVYKTEKQKEVVVIEDNTSNEEAAAKEETITPEQAPIQEIKQFKELLDAGILTQEEFDKKKKELLNL